ncbi:MAG: hypothetical protein K9I26_00810 [Flavobacterium sp.]|nr:hypothetical protein [Flavobacterium sp.]
MILGLFFYIALTIVISIPAFLFSLKVEKFGAFEGKTKNDFLSTFGNPMSILNPTNDIQVLVWLKASGNYMLKLKFNPEGNFIRVHKQLDQTKTGVKDILYGLIMKFI